MGLHCPTPRHRPKVMCIALSRNIWQSIPFQVCPPLFVDILLPRVTDHDCADRIYSLRLIPSTATQPSGNNPCRAFSSKIPYIEQWWMNDRRLSVHLSHSLVHSGHIDETGDQGQARLDLSRYVSPTATGTVLFRERHGMVLIFWRWCQRIKFCCEVTVNPRYPGRK